MASRHLIERGTNMFPAWLYDHGLGSNLGNPLRPNLSMTAERYLDLIDAGVEDLFYCVLSVLHDPAYREANADALRMGWPRIPLPGWPDGEADGTTATFADLTARGGRLQSCLIPMCLFLVLHKVHCIQSLPL